MIICVTGPMASGKNFVSSLIEREIFIDKSFVSIDADKVCHVAIENAKVKIIKTFENLAAKEKISLVDKDEKIIRKNLGALIFKNKDLIAKQEAIVYPEITSIIEAFIKENSHKNIIINATVLYKTLLIEKIDFIIYVKCPWFLRLLRAKKRDKISLKQIIERFNSQRGLYSSYKKTGIKIAKICNITSSKNLLKKLKILITNC